VRLDQGSSDHICCAFDCDDSKMPGWPAGRAGTYLPGNQPW